MDRHQFVESLITKRDDLIDTVEDQEKQNKILHQCSKSYLRKLLEEPGIYTVSSGNILGCSGMWKNVYIESDKKDLYNSVSDEDIISLCIDIGKLRDKVDKLLADNEKLKEDDISEFLKEIIND